MIFDAIIQSLHDVQELVEDCGKTYRLVDGRIKRMTNQAMFLKPWVEKDGSVTADFSPFFEMVANPFEGVAGLCRQQKTRGAEALTDFLSVISGLQKFFGGGWSNNLLFCVDQKEASL